MLAKASWLSLTLAYFVGTAIGAVEAGDMENCNVPETERIGCGSISIARSECTQRGCCYLLASEPGAPSCFYSREEDDDLSRSAAASIPKTPTPSSGASTIARPKVAAGNLLLHSGSAAFTKHDMSTSLGTVNSPVAEVTVPASATTLPVRLPLASTKVSPFPPEVAGVSIPILTDGDLAGHDVDTVPLSENAITISTTTVYALSSAIRQGKARTDNNRAIAAEVASVTTSTWTAVTHQTVTTTLASPRSHRGTITWTTKAYSATLTSAQPSGHNETTASTTTAHSATTLLAPPSGHRGATTSATTTYSAIVTSAPPSGHNGTVTSTTTANLATMPSSPPSGHRGATSSTTTAYSATAALAPPSSHRGTIASTTATVATAELAPPRSHRGATTSSATAYAVPLVTTSTTTAYVAPLVTTSTTTAYVAVTASQVAVVLDMPPHEMPDQPGGTGVGGSPQHQIDLKGGRSASRVVTVTLSVLTVLLVLVAAAAAGQFVVGFLRKASSTASPIAESVMRRTSSGACHTYSALPQMRTECNRLEETCKLYQDSIWMFRKRWDTTEWITVVPGDYVPCPTVHEVWQIEAEPHFGTYLAKQAEINLQQRHKHGYVPGNEQMRFHGARIKCRFNGVPCKDATCSVCRIIEDGNFQSSSIQNEIRFERGSHAAKGYGLAPGKEPPPKNLDDFVSGDAGNAVFIAGVLMGTPDFVTKLTKNRPTRGRHSRVAAKTTRVDEIVIFDSAQAIPRALLLFQ